MIACTLSNLELRGIIESAFLPLRCNCMVIDDSMTIEVIDPVTERVELLRRDVPTAGLDNSRAICTLILKLRDDAAREHALQHHAMAS